MKSLGFGLRVIELFSRISHFADNYYMDRRGSTL